MGKNETGSWETSLEAIMIIQAKIIQAQIREIGMEKSGWILALTYEDKWTGFDNELEVLVGKEKKRQE